MASRKNTPPPAKLEADDFVAIRDVLAHLNFSGGRRDPRFLANLNRLWGKLDAAGSTYALIIVGTIGAYIAGNVVEAKNERI